MAFLCVHAHRREASIVIESLGPVGLIVDVVCHFLEVLEVGSEGHGVQRERDAIRGGRRMRSPTSEVNTSLHGLAHQGLTPGPMLLLHPLLLHDGSWNWDRKLSERPRD